MCDYTGKEVIVCLPGEAVEISGMNEVPQAGNQIFAMDDIMQARNIAEKRKEKARITSRTERTHVTLDNLYAQIGQGSVKEVRIILKTDTQGSAEALKEKLHEVDHQEVRVNIIHSGVGGINTSDIHLADASNAIVIGFHVTPDSAAVSLAQDKGIDIRTYQVIYRVVEDVRAALEGLLEPELKEVETARLEVRNVFKTKNGVVAGCFVKNGKIERSNRIRVARDNVIIYESNLESLRRFQDDAKEVKENFECGVKVENFNDIKVGDELISYKIEKIARSLS
jgi:translation initiation factor IF-2